MAQDFKNNKESILNNTRKDNNNFQSFKILNAWIKKGYFVKIYNSVGGKVTGVIKCVDIYEIILVDIATDQKFIVFKSNIFYITREKRDNK